MTNYRYSDGVNAPPEDHADYGNQKGADRELVRQAEKREPLLCERCCCSWCENLSDCVSCLPGLIDSAFDALELGELAHLQPVCVIWEHPKGDKFKLYTGNPFWPDTNKKGAAP